MVLPKPNHTGQIISDASEISNEIHEQEIDLHGNDENLSIDKDKISENNDMSTNLGFINQQDMEKKSNQKNITVKPDDAKASVSWVNPDIGGFNVNSDDDTDKIELSSTEELKNMIPWSSTIEVVGKIRGVVAPTDVIFKSTGCKGSVFKFSITNDDGVIVQVNVWDEEIPRVLPAINIGSIIHIDGAFSKKIDPKNRRYNFGNIDLELVIRSNTKLTILETMNPRNASELVNSQCPPLITIEDCQNYLDKKIRFQGWIKTNFDVIKLRQEDSFMCCGSIAVGDGYKIETKINHFEQPFKSPFTKGDHVEVTGIMKKYNNRGSILTETIDAIKVIDSEKINYSLLIKSNREVIFENQEEHPFKKSKHL